MNKLVATAIIGTGQQATTDISTGTAVDDLTKQLTREQPERTLLLAAGAWALYQQAGYIPQSPQIAYRPAPVDEKQTCSSKVAQILVNLLQGKHDVLLPEALERLQQTRQCLPHELLPQALIYGAKNKQLQAALLPVLGERGHWLAQFSHEWDWAKTMPTNADFMNKSWPEIETFWQEGTLQQRVEILRHVRTVHPEIALDWMMSTWKKENAEARTSFIALLKINLSARDEEFLERSLNDRSDSVRTQAAYLLERIPASAFNRRMQERADTLLYYVDNRLYIDLSAKSDASWQRDGIVQIDKGSSLPPEVIFSVISRVPPAHWEERFAMSPLMIVNAAAANNVSCDAWLRAVVNGWTIAADYHKATAWFEPLLDWWSKHPDLFDQRCTRIFHDLSQNRAEQYVLSGLLVGSTWIEDLIALPRPWSSLFSRACLQTLQLQMAELVSDNNRYPYQVMAAALVDTIATALPPDCFDIALSEWTFSIDPENSNNWYVKYWVDQINNLKTLVHLRKKLLKEIL